MKMPAEHHADRRGACPECHEHRGKTEREAEGGQKHGPARLAPHGHRIAALELLNGNARHVTEIGRDERQDAGRQEREGSGKKRAQQGNIGDRQ
jgi:hypothetical protein